MADIKKLLESIDKISKEPLTEAWGVTVSFADGKKKDITVAAPMRKAKQLAIDHFKKQGKNVVSAKVYGEVMLYGKHISEGSMTSAAQNPTGPKFGGYWKGTDPNPPKPGVGVGGADESKEIEEDPKFLGEPYIREEDAPLDPPGYSLRVAELEMEGLTTSDAQGIADMEYRLKTGPWSKDREVVDAIGKQVTEEVTLNEGEVDNILEAITLALNKLESSNEYSDEAKQVFAKLHDLLRSYLMKDDVAGFKRIWNEIAGKHPDAFDIFAEETFYAAGIDHPNASFDDFMDVVNAVDENYLGRMEGGASGIVGEDREGEPLFNETEPTPLTYQEVADAWKQVFPHSSVSVSKAFGGGYTFKFRLAKDESEVPNRILDNDPLHYTALLDTDGTFEEYHGHLYVKPPEGANLVYGSEKLRKKTIKNATLEKVLNRFRDVRKFVLSHANELKNPMFDVKEKLRVGSLDEDAWHSDTIGGIFSEDDEYQDSYEDESDLYDGCYVRDIPNDGPRGEIFKMRGDPYDRRVRIEDKDGRGWNISSSRLTKVDDDDPEIGEYFPSGKEECEYCGDPSCGGECMKESLDEAHYGEELPRKAKAGDIVLVIVHHYGGNPKIVTKDYEDEPFKTIDDANDMGMETSAYHHSVYQFNGRKWVRKLSFTEPTTSGGSGYYPGGGVFEGEKELTPIAKLKKANAEGQISADQISKNKAGNFIFRKGYYYRHGMDSQQYADRISKNLTALGIKFQVLGDGDHWASFKGGAGVKQNSHWWVEVKILNDATSPIEETGVLSDPEQNRSLARANIVNPDHEARGIWMQHYRRALGNKQTDAQARHYADMMTRTEPKFAKEEIEESVDDLTEELKTAFEDYVKNKAEPEEKEHVTITYNDGHTQTKYVTAKQKQSYETSSTVKSVTPAAKGSKDRVDDEKLEEVLGQPDPDRYSKRDEKNYVKKLKKQAMKPVKKLSQEVKEDVEGYHTSGRWENVPQRMRQELARRSDQEKWERKKQDAEWTKQNPFAKDVDEAKTANRARGIVMRKLADIEKTNPGKVKEIQTKFKDLTDQLSTIKKDLDAKVGKVEEATPNLAPAGTNVNPNGPNADPSLTTSVIPTTGQNPTPIAAQPQVPAQQRPVTMGTPTAAPGAGQPTPPAAGQAGGAPTKNNDGSPQPPTGGQVNTATTPEEQMKGFLNTIATNPAAAKQLTTKLNTALR